MKLQPLADRIVAKPVEADSKSPAGILLPDQAKEKTQVAEVVAVGPGALDKDGKRVPMEVKVGDRIVHSEYGPNRFKQSGGDELLILKEEDVLAVVKG
jgi:chaperonin GroES